MRKGQKMPEEIKRRISQSEKGKFVSFETRQKMKQIMLGQTEERCRNWSGDRVGYWGIHDWLKKNFNNPSYCELCGLRGRKIGGRWNIHWAKLQGKQYKRSRENFWGLCISCHTKYDMTQEKKDKISKSLKVYFSQNATS